MTPPDPRASGIDLSGASQWAPGPSLLGAGGGRDPPVVHLRVGTRLLPAQELGWSQSHWVLGFSHLLPHVHRGWVRALEHLPSPLGPCPPRLCARWWLPSCTSSSCPHSAGCSPRPGNPTWPSPAASGAGSSANAFSAWAGVSRGAGVGR